MKRVLIGALTAVTAYAIGRSGRVGRNGKQAAEPKEMTAEESLVQWISAEEERQENAEPMYVEGDTVVTINPYTFDYAIVDLDNMTPLYYAVQTVKYDEADKTHRYWLKGEDEWFSEDWLDWAPFPVMAKEEIEAVAYAEEDVKMTKELTESSAELLGAALDEQARKQQVDSLLDVMNEGTPEEKAEAARVLKEITQGATE